jgi:hypothetical protein
MLKQLFDPKIELIYHEDGGQILNHKSGQPNLMLHFPIRRGNEKSLVSLQNITLHWMTRRNYKTDTYETAGGWGDDSVEHKPYGKPIASMCGLPIDYTALVNFGKNLDEKIKLLFNSTGETK